MVWDGLRLVEVHCRRDRLAVITQLLVPLLLVLLAMVVSTLQTSQHQQPQLEMTRQTCLFGAPAMLAAAPAVRQQVEFRGFMDGYPRWVSSGYCVVVCAGWTARQCPSSAIHQLHRPALRPLQRICFAVNLLRSDSLVALMNHHSCASTRLLLVQSGVVTGSALS